MDFLKKHYEKILLGVVLLGLAGAVGLLPFKIASERQSLEDKQNSLIKAMPPKLPDLDMGELEAALTRMANPSLISFSEPNKLFNPMPWQQAADGRLLPGSKVGPGAVTLTNLSPLYLILSLDGVTSLPDGGASYRIGVENQAAASLRDSRKKQNYCKLNDKNATFSLVEVQGPAQEPSGLVLQLNDTGEKAVVATNAPFKRADGYTVTLYYEPEHKTFANRRVGANCVFNFEEYKIVRITTNEVTLEATSNQKKWTIKYNP